jgi:inhibitor of KinA
MARFRTISLILACLTLSFVMRLVPLSDEAVLVYCDSEGAAAQLAASIRANQPSWLVDVVLAYSSVAVFFDLSQIHFHEVSSWLSELKAIDSTDPVRKEVIIGCCYELGPDMDRVAKSKNLTIKDVIRLHTSVTYTVYAIGFVPGFPYLGYLPDELAGLPRLDKPRLQVEPGSVGVTGRQTGIYPLPRPGGWNLIGRTPLQLVDLESDYFALAPGDRVRFRSINADEYQRLLGTRP